MQKANLFSSIYMKMGERGGEGGRGREGEFVCENSLRLAS
jgi:hypothetical protein